MIKSMGKLLSCSKSLFATLSVSGCHDSTAFTGHLKNETILNGSSSKEVLCKC